MIIRVLLLTTLLHACIGQELSLETISKQFHLRRKNPINSTSLSAIWELNFEDFAELLRGNNYNLKGLTPTCQQDLHFTFEAITNTVGLGKNNTKLAMDFTLPLLDSWAKRPPPGVLRGNLRVPGYFLECRDIHYYSNSLNRFVDGEYYRVFHNINPNKPDTSGVCALTASYDICLPRSCAEQDLTNMFKQNKKSTCQVRSTNQMTQKVDVGTYIVGTIMGSITFFALISSVIDYYLPDEDRASMDKTAYVIITAFSFHRNVSDMFKVKHVNKQTGCLNCFRFFSISWVMAGHMFMIQGGFENNVLDQLKWMNNFQASFYVNAFFSVDSFFFMSGFLVAFSWFKGCLTGVDKRFTSKIGCRTNYLGASLCVCEDGDFCNRIERTDNTLRPLPTIRLPLVECHSKVTGSDIFGSRREHTCSANYCHMTHTETYSDSSAPDVLNVYKCGDMAEFDFDVRIKNSVSFPGLYSNGCYKIQTDPKEIVTDCNCAKNNCNSGIPVVMSGPVRCYLGNSMGNETEIVDGKFCDGDYCFMQKNGNLYSKGCISVNERNSWSHLKSGYRHIVGVDQWLCQSHLCNYDLKRIQRSIIPIEEHHPIQSISNNFAMYYLSVCLALSFIY